MMLSWQLGNCLERIFHEGMFGVQLSREMSGRFSGECPGEKVNTDRHIQTAFDQLYY